MEKQINILKGLIQTDWNKVDLDECRIWEVPLILALRKSGGFYGFLASLTFSVLIADIFIRLILYLVK